jgi:hypothetical protein
MNMIDWYLVGFNALWIMGLGLVTAGLSLANYLGSRQNWRFGQALKIPACKIMIGLGLVFFCLGLAGDVSTIWERLLWVVLALIFVFQTWRTREIGNP